MKIAKLYIKGMQHPVDLNEEYGAKADAMIKREGIYSDLNDEDTISLGGFWTGPAGDLRSVYWIDTNPSSRDEIRYSSEQLTQFENSLKPFFTKRDDDVYNRLFNKYLNYVKSGDFENGKLDKKPSATPFTVARLNAIRSQFSSDDDRKREIHKLLEQRVIGTLSLEGENKYYEKMNVASINDGIFTVTNSNLYLELSQKIAQYQNMVGRKRFAEDQKALNYQRNYM